jgi:hypothetical protein
MIRKWSIFGILVMMFLYVSWNLYSEVIRYNPLSGNTQTEQTNRNSLVAEFPEFSPGWSKNILSKSIFSRSRTYAEPRPVVVQDTKPVVPPPPPPKRPELALKGIVLDLFGEYVAFIEKDKAKAVPARKGDMIDDVEIVDVSARKTAVRWNSETIELSMDMIKTISNPR